MKAKFVKGITLGATVCALILTGDKSVKEIVDGAGKRIKKFVKNQML